MSEIFIIKDTGKGVINDLAPEKVVPIKVPQSGGTIGDYIPLTGTVEGKGITGNILFQTTTADKIIGIFPIAQQAIQINNVEFSQDGLVGTQTLMSLKGTIFSFVQNSVTKVMLLVGEDGIIIQDDLLNKGIEGQGFYGANYTDNTYVQKKYVDQANSYSTTEIKTGGTWIDGKPIYTVTQLTAESIPAGMETRFPDEIIGDYTVYKYTKTTDPTP